MYGLIASFVCAGIHHVEAGMMLATFFSVVRKAGFHGRHVRPCTGNVEAWAALMPRGIETHLCRASPYRGKKSLVLRRAGKASAAAVRPGRQQQGEGAGEENRNW